jgi:hypothetical protein
MRGELECRVCGVKYATKVNGAHGHACSRRSTPGAGAGQRLALVCAHSPCAALSDPVDIYAEWIDKCEEVARAPPPKAGPRDAAPAEAAAPPSSAARAARQEKKARAAAAAAAADAPAGGEGGERKKKKKARLSKPVEEVEAPDAADAAADLAEDERAVFDD